MNCYKRLALIISSFTACAAGAQELSTKTPFSISLPGITITGTYSQGYMYKHTVNGTNILWGLISWGGEQTIECRPGNSICVFNLSTSIHLRGIQTNKSGQKSLDFAGVAKEGYPVVVSKNGNTLQFAVDVQYVPAAARTMYRSGTWKVENSFVLDPQTVRDLGLYSGSEPMGFIIPAGEYPLHHDGNVSYWTWTIPN
jgi:hypothetical protein